MISSRAVVATAPFWAAILARSRRGALAALAGADPLAVFGLIVTGAAGSKLAILETLNRATPLIFTGLAVTVAFRAKLWNIGAEGQFLFGILVGGGIALWLTTNGIVLPQIVALPLVLLILLKMSSPSSLRMLDLRRLQLSKRYAYLTPAWA